MVRTFPSLLALVLMASLGVASDLQAQEVYSYTDDSGRTHFTDSYGSIPERYRDQATILDENRESSGSVVIIPRSDGASKSSGAGADDGASKPGAFALMQRATQGGALGIGVGLVLLAVATAIGLSICAVMLMFACAIVGEEGVAFGRAMLIAFCMALANAAVGIPMQIVGGTTAAQGAPLFWLVLAFAAGLAASAAVLRSMHCETAGSAVKVAVVYTLMPVLLGIGIAILLLMLRALLP